MMRATDNRPRQLLRRLWWFPAIATGVYLLLAIYFAIEQRWFFCGANMILAGMFAAATRLERGALKRFAEWDGQRPALWRQDLSKGRTQANDETGAT